MRKNNASKEQLERSREQCRALFERLNEQDKRHVAGLLAILAGHGGVTWVAEAVGLQRDCVSRGKAEVENGLEGRPVDRQRLPGGGRKPLEKKVPKSSMTSRKSSRKIREGCRPDDESSSE